MTPERNAKEIVVLAFRPVSRWIEADQQISLWRVIRQLHAHLQQPVLPDGTEVIDRLDMLDHIHARDTGEHLEAQVIADDAGGVEQSLARNLDTHDPVGQSRLWHPATDGLVYLRQQIEQISN